MRKERTKQKYNKLLRGQKLFFIICFILISGFFIFCLCYRGTYISHHEYYIDSKEDLVKILKHSDKTKATYNYVITKKSIEIDVDEIPQNISFYGHLNGRGNKIIINGSTDSSMITPMFDKIQEGAKIERLAIETNIELGADDNVSDIALLAHENFGTITDCSFLIDSIFIGSKCQNASAIVNRNFGEINSVCVSVESVNSSQTKDNWQCNFGAVATANFGAAKNVFLNVELNDFGIFNTAYNNRHVGYFFSSIGSDNKKNVIDNVFLFGGGKYWDFSLDAARFDNDLRKGEKPNDNLLSEFLKYNGTVSNAWSSSLIDENTGFPLLKNS